jgi:glycosyltransferase involved in cell wall biosynthesis
MHVLTRNVTMPEFAVPSRLESFPPQPAVAFSGEVFRLQRVGGASRMVLELHRSLLARAVSTFISSKGSISTMTDATDRLSDRTTFAYRGRGATHAANAVGRRADRTLLGGLTAPWIVHRSYFGPRLRINVPIAVTVYDMIAELYPESFPRTDPTPRHKRESVREAALVFAISETTKSDLIRILDCDPKKIRVLPLGVNPPSEEAEQQTAERGGLASKPYVLYVGQRGGYKNFSTLLAAFRAPALKELELVCFGGPPLTAEELALVQRHTLHGRVRHVVGDDVLLGAFYRAAACLVYPSRYEGFGIPPLEAMVRGCPVVATTGGSIPEVVGDAAELVDPDDVDGFASAIDDLLTDDARRRDRVVAGYERAALYSWARTGDVALSAYRELV